MKKYFKFIGYFIMIGFVAGLIYFVILIIPALKTGDVGTIVGFIFGLIAFIVFGPAIGMLFLSHADQLPDNGQTIDSPSNNETVKYGKAKKNGTIFAIGTTVTLKYEVSVFYHNDKKIPPRTRGTVRKSDAEYTTVYFVGYGEVKVQNSYLK